jgi:hypothetical protein
MFSSVSKVFRSLVRIFNYPVRISNQPPEHLRKAVRSFNYPVGIFNYLVEISNHPPENLARLLKVSDFRIKIRPGKSPHQLPGLIFRHSVFWRPPAGWNLKTPRFWREMQEVITIQTPIT